MNDKGHFYISLIKSIIRALGCIIGLVLVYNSMISLSLALLMAFLLSAEVLGVLEEVFDKRWSTKKKMRRVEMLSELRD